MSDNQTADTGRNEDDGFDSLDELMSDVDTDDVGYQPPEDDDRNVFETLSVGDDEDYQDGNTDYEATPDESDLLDKLLADGGPVDKLLADGGPQMVKADPELIKLARASRYSRQEGDDGPDPDTGDGAEDDNTNEASDPLDDILDDDDEDSHVVVDTQPEEPENGADDDEVDTSWATPKDGEQGGEPASVVQPVELVDGDDEDGNPDGSESEQSVYATIPTQDPETEGKNEDSSPKQENPDDLDYLLDNDTAEAGAPAASDETTEVDVEELVETDPAPVEEDVDPDGPGYELIVVGRDADRKSQSAAPRHNEDAAQDDTGVELRNLVKAADIGAALGADDVLRKDIAEPIGVSSESAGALYGGLVEHPERVQVLQLFSTLASAVLSPGSISMVEYGATVGKICMLGEDDMRTFVSAANHFSNSNMRNRKDRDATVTVERVVESLEKCQTTSASDTSGGNLTSRIENVIKVLEKM